MIITEKRSKYVTLDHKTSHKLHGYMCSNSQQYTVWIKMIDFSFMAKIISNRKYTKNVFD